MSFHPVPYETLVAHCLPPEIFEYRVTIPHLVTSSTPAAAARSATDTKTTYKPSIYSAQTIPGSTFTACFNLISTTSADTYAASSIGWSPPNKQCEMRLPDMWYIVLEPDNDDNDAPVPAPDIAGFLSFMLTTEDNERVIYLYEIHLAPRAQRRGVGGALLGFYEAIGRRVGVGKAMLTVFRSNHRAIGIYQARGFAEDERHSPRARVLRNGRCILADYMIFSKVL